MCALREKPSKMIATKDGVSSFLLVVNEELEECLQQLGKPVH